MNFSISPLNHEFEAGAAVIRDAFITVAHDFNLTKETSPTNPAFIEAESLRAMHEKGVELYIAFEDGKPVGFAALEKADSRTGYLEKLAVLPDCRHKGYGKKLVDFIFHRAKELGLEQISIGIVNENTVLKNWYISLGFKETGLKTFPHLPFQVCFMAITI